MSNRTLIEINHDQAHEIDRKAAWFSQVVYMYLCSGDKTRWQEELERFGVRIIGMKHHSAAHSIDWGGIKDTEERSA